MRKSKKMKPGKLKGPSHKNSGILLEAEGGEFIFSKAATKEIGVNTLKKANKERKLPQAGHGGVVGGKIKKRKSGYKKGGHIGCSIKTYSNGGYIEGK